jgi:transcriptional regulator with XRE-family HTH domain
VTDPPRRTGRPRTRTVRGAHLSPNDRAIAARLDAQRQERGMTLAAVVEKSGLKCSVHQMSKYISGENRIPAGKVYAICHALQLYIEAAFADCRPPPRPGRKK